MVKMIGRALAWIECRFPAVGRAAQDARTDRFRAQYRAAAMATDDPAMRDFLLAFAGDPIPGAVD